MFGISKGYLERRLAEERNDTNDFVNQQYGLKERMNLYYQQEPETELVKITAQYALEIFEYEELTKLHEAKLKCLLAHKLLQQEEMK